MNSSEKFHIEHV